ncbi:MAG: hypothetical protein ACR2NO_03110, partial [Chloroflexota bacterium]
SGPPPSPAEILTAPSSVAAAAARPPYRGPARRAVLAPAKTGPGYAAKRGNKLLEEGTYRFRNGARESTECL